MTPRPCDDCGLRVYDLNPPERADGKHLHVACAERMDRNGLPEKGPRVFEVEVTYSGTCMVTVVACSAEEAEKIALEDADLDTWNADTDIDSSKDIGVPATPAQIRNYEQRLEREAVRERLRALSKDKPAAPPLPIESRT